MDIEIKTGNSTYTLKGIPELESKEHVHVLESDDNYIVLGVEEEDNTWFDLQWKWPSGVAFIQRTFGRYGRNSASTIQNEESGDEDPSMWYLDPHKKHVLKSAISEDKLQAEKMWLDTDYIEAAGSKHYGTYYIYCDVETPTRVSSEDEDEYTVLEAADYNSWFHEIYSNEEHPWSRSQIEAAWWLICDCKFDTIEQLHELLINNVEWHSASTCTIKTAAFPEFIKRCREHYYVVIDPEYYYNVSCSDHGGLHYYIGPADSSNDIGVLHIQRSCRKDLDTMDPDKKKKALKTIVNCCMHLLNGDSSQCINAYIFDKKDIILDDYTTELEMDSIYWEDECNIPTYMEDVKQGYINIGYKVIEHKIL
jgi:hypothetical protein